MDTHDLQHVNAPEPHTSWIIEKILSYQNSSGQFPLLYSFADTFLKDACGFDLAQIRKPNITAEESRIDVCIREKNKYAIIIENKLKGADYQRNQLARYIRKLIEEGYFINKIYIIIIPERIVGKDYIIDLPTSIWRCPPDWKVANNFRKCKLEGCCKCWCDDNSHILTEDEKLHCSKCSGEKYYSTIGRERAVAIHRDFVDWLISILNSDNLIEDIEWPLKSMIGLFADYLKYIYNIRENQKLTEEMIEVIEKELFNDKDASFRDKIDIITGKIESVEYLEEQLINLRQKLYGQLIDSWYNIFKEEETIEEYLPGNHFMILIGTNIYCGCWLDDNNEGPYWGFRTKSQNYPSQNQIRIVNKIMDSIDEIEPNYSDQNNGWIAWGYSLGCEKIVRQLLQSARSLGYIKE